jgi:hypothetical protein
MPSITNREPTVDKCQILLIQLSASGYKRIDTGFADILEYFLCDRDRNYDSKSKDPNTRSSRQWKRTGFTECGHWLNVVLR